MRFLEAFYLIGLLPVMGFAYLGFCYAAATHVIPLHMFKIDGNPEDYLCESFVMLKCSAKPHFILKMLLKLQ